MFKVPEIDVEVLKNHISKYILVDVREAFELTGPQGQIKGIILATLGSELIQFLTMADPQQEYVFICRSGCRSDQACQIAYAYGFRNIYNMKGGMLAWQKLMCYSP